LKNNNINRSFKDDLYLKIWITRGSRFNAHQRLMSKHRWSIASIAFLSAYVLIISITGYVIPTSVNSQQQQVLNFSAIAFSLLILVLSLLEMSKSYEMKANAFHECGRKLSHEYNRLQQILYDSGITNISIELSDISQKYDAILDSCPDNHDNIDYEVFKLQHPRDFPMSVFVRTWITLKKLYFTSFIYLILIFLPLIIIPLILFL
jgi:hypothetical protein